ncbi:MAG: ABC transporter ATP-binding protein [Parcubacteria group bacterium]|nr:ABC transporter ATP-binding protein [Parcubacteria group bacterium]
MLLSVQNLKVVLSTDEGPVTPVDDISFSIRRGTTLALVGESGSGKSMTAYAIADLLPPIGRIESGSVRLDNEDLTELPASERRALRGTKIAMIFQKPLTALHPAKTIADQMIEMVVVRMRWNRDHALATAEEKLRLVGLPEPAKRMKQYPHELSGGQRQRVMIAMMLMGDPELLICDEPTTALDVTIQAQIIELLKELQERLNLTILLITHDMGVVADMAHHVCVMKDGELVEDGTVDQIFNRPHHPYTRKLLAAVSVLGSFSEAEEDPVELAPVLLEIKGLRVEFPLGGGLLRRAPEVVRAVAGVDLIIRQGETVALVGESGCGKSTLGRAIMGLIDPADGEVLFDSRAVHNMDRVGLQTFRRRAQMIFQDPESSLNPRMRVGDLVTEPLVIHGIDTPARRLESAVELLERVGLEADHIRRYPHEFSGGQQQRICVARALILQPDFIVCDEPTSALDVSVQAEVLGLMRDLREEFGLTLLFISHDLAVVEELADRVAVMYLGRIVELGRTAKVIGSPQHPYTQALLSAVPIPDPARQAQRERIHLLGEPPSTTNPPTGCAFHPRCRMAEPGTCPRQEQALKLHYGREIACGVVTGS